jgi:hypothetical protein
VQYRSLNAAKQTRKDPINSPLQTSRNTHHITHSSQGQPFELSTSLFGKCSIPQLGYSQTIQGSHWHVQPFTIPSLGYFVAIKYDIVIFLDVDTLQICIVRFQPTLFFFATQRLGEIVTFAIIVASL